MLSPDTHRGCQSECLVDMAVDFGFFGAIFHANNERSKSTLDVRHFLLILAK